jgi:HNH endonuclease
MKIPRVKRSKGPTSAMTEFTYRKKALPHLMKDFDGHCAYCLDPKEFRAPSQSHVEHFDCKLKGRKRHFYKNLMLACAACNMSKHGKPVRNPFNAEQRLINCTEENEFVEHIRETEDGQWEAMTPAGRYHLESIGLREDCHRNKRRARRVMIEEIAKLFKTAVKYETHNPAELHDQMMVTIRSLLTVLDNFPPLVIASGTISARNWLRLQGVEISV